MLPTRCLFDETVDEHLSLCMLHRIVVHLNRKLLKVLYDL